MTVYVENLTPYFLNTLCTRISSFTANGYFPQKLNNGKVCFYSLNYLSLSTYFRERIPASIVLRCSRRRAAAARSRIYAVWFFYVPARVCGFEVTKEYSTSRPVKRATALIRRVSDRGPLFFIPKLSVFPCGFDVQVRAYAACDLAVLPLKVFDALPYRHQDMAVDRTALIISHKAQLPSISSSMRMDTLLIAIKTPQWIYCMFILWLIYDNMS